MTDTFEHVLANLQAMVEQGRQQAAAGPIAAVGDVDPGMATALTARMVEWARTAVAS